MGGEMWMGLTSMEQDMFGLISRINSFTLCHCNILQLICGHFRSCTGVEFYFSQGTVCTRGVRAPTCAVASVRNLRSREAVGCQWLHLDCDTLRKFNRRETSLKMFCISKLVASLKSVFQKLREKYSIITAFFFGTTTSFEMIPAVRLPSSNEVADDEYIPLDVALLRHLPASAHAPDKSFPVSTRLTSARRTCRHLSHPQSRCLFQECDLL